jgi:hypothetical protein
MKILPVNLKGKIIKDCYTTDEGKKLILEFTDNTKIQFFVDIERVYGFNNQPVLNLFI